MIRKTLLFAAPFFLSACSENPTALDDLDTDVQFAIDAKRLETFQQIPIRITATESGAPMQMDNALLEVRYGESVEVRTVALERDADAYQAHVYFYEEGEYHLQMKGRLEGHAITGEFGDLEVRVERQRQLIGSYWVEIEIAGGPVVEHSDRQIHLMVYDLLTDGTRGSSVSSLVVTAFVQAPDGDQTESRVSSEGDGEYALVHAFDHAGGYQLHVTIEAGGGTLEGEFQIPVHDPAALDDGTAEKEEGGVGNGH